MTKIGFDDLRRQMRSGDMSGFKELYLSLKSDFLKFIIKSGSDGSEAEEIYNDTFLALHDNITGDKTSVIQNSLKSYIYGIGKHMMYKRFKQKNQLHQKELPLKSLVDFHDPFEKDVKISDDVLLAVDQLGEGCQKILDLFYFKKYSVEAITLRLGYKNENSVKAHKSRCMKQLRAIIFEKRNEHHVKVQS